MSELVQKELSRIKDEAPQIAAAVANEDSPHHEEARARLEQLRAWSKDPALPEQLRREAVGAWYEVDSINQYQEAEKIPLISAPLTEDGHNWERVLDKKDEEWAERHGFPTYRAWAAAEGIKADPDELSVNRYLKERNNYRLRDR